MTTEPSDPDIPDEGPLEPDLPDPEGPPQDPDTTPGIDSPFGELGNTKGAEFQQGTGGAEPLAPEVDREGF